MRQFIFLTNEGTIYQLNSETQESDASNIQVLGFGNGKDEEEAFISLVKENKYLLDTNYDSVFPIELDYAYKDKPRRYFYLSDVKGEEKYAESSLDAGRLPYQQP